ncbi:MAG: vitamin K epoxide reductase family protein [Candidatus Marinimicrobia bacterium]|nr:vitamin K epoxide reductase family protein [Candidatus Neomarinimicrobiota bacterium]
MKKQQNYFEFIFYVLGLIGILITIHLYIMDNRGFDRGCLGFTTSQTVEAAFDCESVLDSELGQILGISNVYWGMAFYFSLVFLNLLLFFGKSSLQKYLRILRAIAIGAGFCYSIFLVYYQKTVLDEYCALCLMSAVTIFLLSLTQIIYIFKFPFVKETDTPISRKLVVILAAVTVFISTSDFIYFNNLESIKIVEETHVNNVPPSTTLDPFSSSSPTHTNTLPGDCKYDETKPVVENYLSLINEFDYRTGNSGSKNLVMELFDPNCLHCKRLSHVLAEFIDKNHKEAFFVIKPIPLWSYSIIQIQALYIAAESGLFIEMMDEQFERQRPGKGLSMNELKEIAYNLGIDGHLMAQRIQNNDYRKYILEEHKKTRAAGIKSAPTLMINGKIVAVKSRTLQCLGELIQE